MLPKQTAAPVPVSLKEATKPTRTFAMDQSGKRIQGFADGTEALKGTVYCILNTERYDFLLYSWNYGLELKDLYGKPMSYVKSELKRRITEALTQDDRIKGVSDFAFEQLKGKLSVSFVVNTIFGNMSAEKEVEI